MQQVRGVERRSEQALSAGHVEVRLVDGGHLDHRRETVQNLEDPPGVLVIARGMAVQENGLRAALVGCAQGKRGVHAVLAGNVVGRRHHAPLLWRAAHDDRLADQFWPVTLLDRGVKGVLIYV